ncbi:MAG: nucleoside triphosphate pyrophosphohydrolase [Clostridiales bacterium]|nr:nucleoside triphosphate pyrophosphohydrolase [Clostridiales bacterium]
MVNFEEKETYSFEDLREIIRLLRSPDGCPWDKVQTHASLRRGMLEEAYEAVEAIDLNDPDLLCEELGDVLMQVVFHASLEEDAGRFTMDDIADHVVKKLLFRHPHVFGQAVADTPQEVLVSWDQLKRQEKGQNSTADAMDAVARSLPGLWRAEKIQGKAAKAGFDWPDVAGALDKLDEETRELREAVAVGESVEEELGDVLFAAVKVGRFAHIDPEAAIAGTCEKFIRRFRFVEEALCNSGRSMEDMPISQLNHLWDKAKLS